MATFGKSKPPGADAALASRLRNIAERAPPRVAPQAKERAPRQALFRNATIILPVPSLLGVFAAGSAFDPLLVGLIAGFAIDPAPKTKPKP
mgnify:CR=1 FL=1